jgi:Protein of unknown function (DUF2752)
VGAQPVVLRAQRADRSRNLLLLGTLIAWLLYTRSFWFLSQAHLTAPTCPFLRLTGHPCPFCGGTRSFAYLWNGDLRHAVLLYPLGPLLFALVVAAVPLLIRALLFRRDLTLPAKVVRPAAALGAGLLVASWGLKLTVLPN